MRVTAIISLCFTALIAFSARTASSAETELSPPATQVPLMGQVRKKQIPRELFFEKEASVITDASLLTAGFLSYNDHPFGYIVDFEIEKDAAVPGDKVFVDRGAKAGVKPGQRYFVYRRGQEVVNPHNRDNYGYLVSIVGLIEIADVKEDASSAKVTRAFDMIYKDDNIMPEFTVITPKMDADKPVADKKISGAIMAVRLGKDEISQDDFVYLSVGRQDGVEEADIFSIYSVNKKNDYESGKFGIEKKIGKVRIVFVRGDSATALVVKSESEIKVGDKVSFAQER